MKPVVGRLVGLAAMKPVVGRLVGLAASVAAFLAFAAPYIRFK